MTQFDLTDDQLQIQEMARKFTADAITPFAAEWDEKKIFPRDTIREAAELGFGAIYVAEESGGIGLGRLEAALIMEAMAYGCPSTSAFISIGCRCAEDARGPRWGPLCRLGIQSVHLGRRRKRNLRHDGPHG